MCAKPCFVHKFNAHDALEDVKALRKILFTAPIQVPNETLVNHMKLTLSNENKIPSSRMTELKIADQPQERIAFYTHDPEDNMLIILVIL